jgi:hypothetical protein
MGASVPWGVLASSTADTSAEIKYPREPDDDDEVG